MQIPVNKLLEISEKQGFKVVFVICSAIFIIWFVDNQNDKTEKILNAQIQALNDRMELMEKKIEKCNDEKDQLHDKIYNLTMANHFKMYPPNE